MYEEKAKETDEKQKKARHSRLALEHEEVYGWLSEKVLEVYGVNIVVKDFKKNNGMTELLGPLGKVAK